MSSRRILFLRAKKKTDLGSVPQLGIGILSALLKNEGHEVATLDQLLYLRSAPPPPIEVVKSFKPDILGLTLYTSTLSESIDIITSLRKHVDAPVVVGGPHSTLYAEELATLGIADYIVKGEAEKVICDVMRDASRQPKSVIIEAPKPEMTDVPIPDFRDFNNYEKIRTYPMQTSRGCPYQCRFCAVRYIASQRWRKRDIGLCVEELKLAKKRLPNLTSVKMVDDAPTTDRNRFKDFLRQYISEGIGLNMVIDNMRADSVDPELVELAKRAGNESICIAVEHADPVVFGFVNKGETLEQIRKAAEYIKEGGLKLGTCFIIGLPFDSYEKSLSSVMFAREIKADSIFWNMAHPMKGTLLRDWFEANGGTFYPDEDYTSFDTHSVKCLDPVVETADFTRAERKKAYFRAVIMTGQYHLGPREVFYLFWYGAKFQLLGPALSSLGAKLTDPEELMYSLKSHVKRLIFLASSLWRKIFK